MSAKIRKYSVPCLAGMLLALAAVPASSWAQEEAEFSTEGLQKIEEDRRSSLFTDPEADWSLYTEIQLLPATVSFRRNWQRDQNRSQPFKVKAEDMERIKSEMAAMFQEVFSEELTANGGYTLAEAAGEQVMTIRPAIVDLDIYAPDTQRAVSSRSFTESEGRMTLKLEITDSVTGDVMAVASSRREAPRRGYMQWTTSVSNRAEARRIMQLWARDLRQYLEQARSET